MFSQDLKNKFLSDRFVGWMGTKDKAPFLNYNQSRQETWKNHDSVKGEPAIVISQSWAYYRVLWIDADGVFGETKRQRGSRTHCAHCLEVFIC